MSKISTFNHYNLSAKKRNVLNVSSFLGVDYNKSEINVSDNHATDLINVIRGYAENGDSFNQKRTGYQAIARQLVDNSSYSISGKFKNLYEIKDNNNNNVFIAHIGSYFYVVNGLKEKLVLNDKEKYLTNLSYTRISATTYSGDASFGIVSNKKLYVLTGNKIVVIYFNSSNSIVLTNAEDISYIPTTSIAISCIQDSLQNISALDDVNLLSDYVYNKLICMSSQPTGFPTWVLDNTFDNEKAHLDNSFIKYQKDGSDVYLRVLSNSSMALGSGITYIERIVEGGTTTQIPFVENNIKRFPIFANADVVLNPSTTWNELATKTQSFVNTHCLGYFELNTIDKSNKLVLFTMPLNSDTTNKIEMQVKYAFRQSNNDVKKRINECTFGIVNNGRLFVSGNPNYPNCDWHTSGVANIDNSYDNGDLTYFSDLDYCYYGTSTSKVVGYANYQDGSLIVFKDKSLNEATIYKRTLEYKQAYDYTGNAIANATEEYFECKDLNQNSEFSAINQNLICNFNGDVIFMTNRGLKVLTARENVYENSKYCADLSTYINRKLLNEDYSNGYLFAFKDKLYLKTDKCIYIAEYNYRNENNEFEWYLIDSVETEKMFNLDENLIFIKNDYSICTFYEDKFVDTDRTYFNSGSVNISNGKVSINSSYLSSIHDGDNVDILRTNGKRVHAEIGTFVQSHVGYNEYIGKIKEDNDNNVLLEFEPKIFSQTTYLYEDDVEKQERQYLMYGGKNVYIDNVIVDDDELETNFLPNKLYRLEEYDSNGEYNTYRLVDEDGNYISYESNIKSFRLSFVADEYTNIQVAELDVDNSEFSVYGEHNQILYLITYNNEATMRAIISSDKTYNCYYITKPFNFGTSVYSKNVYKWVLSNDTGIGSYVDIGYLSTNKEAQYNIAIKTDSGSVGYDYNRLDFNSIQFEADGLPHIYTRNKFLYNLGYIKFMFKNDKDKNMIINQLSIVYSISQQIMGVK